MEIYNEKVRDLLDEHSPSSNQNGGQLKIREHPKSGPYVQGKYLFHYNNKRTLIYNTLLRFESSCRQRCNDCAQATFGWTTATKFGCNP